VAGSSHAAQTGGTCSAQSIATGVRNSASQSGCLDLIQKYILTCFDIAHIEIVPPTSMRFKKMSTARFFMFGSLLLYAFFQWLIIATIAHLDGLSEVGGYSASLAILSPLFMFLSMKLRTIVINETDDKKVKAIVEYRVLCGIIACLIGLLIYHVTGPGQFPRILSSLLVYKGCESVHDIILGTEQRREKYAFVAISTVAAVIVCYSAYLISYLLSSSLPTALLWMSFARALLVLVHGQSIWRYTSEVKLGNMTEQLKKYLPLGISSLLSSFNTHIPRLVIGSVLGLEALGVFTSIGYIVVFLNLAAVTMCQVFAKEIRGNVTVGNSGLEIPGLIVTAQFSLMLLLLILSVYWGGEILTFMYGDGLSSYSGYLTLFCVVGFFISLSKLLQVYLTIHGSYSLQLWYSMTEGVVLLISSFFLAESLGLFGIAIAMLFSTSLATLLVCVSKKWSQISIESCA
jgi:O-antigen/teichoic acid export membrane protein